MNKEIKRAIMDFIEAADQSNTSKLDRVLHEAYRNIQLGFFAKKGLFIIDKNKYLELIQNKTFGGIKRSISYESITINGEIASVNVILESKKMIFYSLITLVKENGIWYVMANYPHFEYKNETTIN